MLRPVFTAAMAAALAVVSLQPAFAAPKKTATPNPVQAVPKAKMIKFHVRNDSQQAMTVRDGEVEVTIAPGETASLKLPLGTNVVSVNGTGSLAPGALVGQVMPFLEGNTIAVR